MVNYNEHENENEKQITLIRYLNTPSVDMVTSILHIKSVSV